MHPNAQPVRDAQMGDQARHAGCCMPQSGAASAAISVLRESSAAGCVLSHSGLIAAQLRDVAHATRDAGAPSLALRAIYERHTRQHHQYFSDLEPSIDTTREFRIVFFPWRVLITLGVGGLTLGWLASLVFNANVGYVVFVTMVAQYLVYETFHYCCHVHENWFVRNMPFVNTIRRHHTAHHNLGIMMKYNMNLTLPDRRLVPRHERPAPRPGRTPVQRLQREARQGRAEAHHCEVPHRPLARDARRPAAHEPGGKRHGRRLT